jgi:hypothetical protein
LFPGLLIFTRLMLRAMWPAWRFTPVIQLAMPASWRFVSGKQIFTRLMLCSMSSAWRVAGIEQYSA